MNGTVLHMLARSLCRTLATALLLGAAILTGAPSRAQSNGASSVSGILPPDDERYATALEHQVITSKAVDVLTRAATTRLRAIPNPSKADFQAAALAISIIRRLAPDDPELLRFEIEAWTTAGSEVEALAATRELLRIDPGDQIAQLRVVLAGIDKLQDVDTRLAAYDRILGPRGRSIDPSVRSHLAFDAALLARDNGNEDRFLEYLTTATTLDPSNKEAAATFGTYVMGSTEDPMTRIEVLENIILSAPLDPGAYENLALEALRHGAHEAALRAFTLATGILSAQDVRVTPQRIFEFALCEWRTRGPGVAMKRIEQVRQDTIAAEEQRRAAREAQGLAVTYRPTFLPPELDMLRLAIAVSRKSESEIERIMTTFLAANDSLVERVEEAEASATTAKGVRDAHISMQVVRLQRLWALLFSGTRLDEAEQLFAQILEDSAPPDDDDDASAERDAPEADRGTTAPDQTTDPSGENAVGVAGAEGDAEPIEEAASSEEESTAPPPLAPEVIQRFKGWIAAKRGENDLAKELLSPLVERDQNARWAMGALLEREGDTRGAMLQFARLALDNPRSALGAAGWSRLLLIRGEPLALPPIARAIDQQVSNFAPWLESCVNDPASFMSIELKHVETEIDLFGSLKVRMTVRNTSLWPLGVGAERPVPKRVLLAPRLRLRTRDATRLVGPIVVLIPNRLRLGPSEAVSMIVTPTRDAIGGVLDATPTARASIRWQAVQGFVPSGQAGGYAAGALTVSTLSDVATRANVDGSVTPEDLAVRIGLGTGASLLTNVAVARHLAGDARTEEGDRSTENMLMNAIVERLPSMDPIEQAVTLGWLGESPFANEDSFGPMIREAVGHDDPYVALVLLLKLIRSPDDPHLEALVSADDNELSRLAFLIREQLRAGVEPPSETSLPAEAPTPPGDSTP